MKSPAYVRECSNQDFKNWKVNWLKKITSTKSIVKTLNFHYIFGGFVNKI